ncbi:MAG: hypothetical protein ACR2O3_10935 [Rhizobiaceae bacterium]
MRKSLLVIALSTLAACMVPTLASAQSTPGVDKREHRQAKRIFHGVGNGSLTARETGQLLRGEARIHRMEHRFKRDGVVTAGERVRLHRNLNRQSRRIYRKKHN